MAFVYTLDPAEPADGESAALGAGRIREFKNAIIERIESLIADVDTDPWSVKAVIPAADNTYALGTALKRFSDVQAMTATFAGQVDVNALLRATSTTMQLALRYDISNYMTATVSSAGAVTLDAVGASAGFTFSDAVTIQDGTGAAPSLKFASDLTTGLFRAASETIGFAAGGAERARLNGSAFTTASGVAIVVTGAGISATTVTLSGAATALRVYTGSTLATNCVSGAATTVQAIPDVKGIYAVSVFGGNATAAFGYFYANGAGSMAAFGTSLTGSASAFGTSGMNVRFTQSSGSDMSVDAYYTRVG